MLTRAQRRLNDEQAHDEQLLDEPSDVTSNDVHEPQDFDVGHEGSLPDDAATAARTLHSSPRRDIDQSNVDMARLIAQLLNKMLPSKSCGISSGQL